MTCGWRSVYGRNVADRNRRAAARKSQHYAQAEGTRIPVYAGGLSRVIARSRCSGLYSGIVDSRRGALVISRRACTLALAIAVTAGGRAVAADEIRVAVATNFSETMAELVELFEHSSEHTVLLS